MAEDKPVKSLEDNSEIVTYGMFEPFFYPDNTNRERRVNELQNDIRMYIVELVNKKEKLDSLLETLKKKLDHIADDLKFYELKEMVKKPIYEEKNLLIPKIIMVIFDIE
ncbi:22452_t:CDS:1, partial [Dentiscutata erythropus]